MTRKAGTGPCSGNSIFLPAAGGRNNSDLDFTGSDGYYWSSSLGTGDSGSAYVVFFNGSSYDRYHDNRFFGQSVRAVTE